jgi:hypothetical protein
MLVGGIGLLWIAYKLLADDSAGEQHGPWRIPSGAR